MMMLQPGHSQGFSEGNTAVAHPLTGIALGRRERAHGPLIEIAEVSVAKVCEACTDLAIADRVAFVLARRTGHAHAVLAEGPYYLVVQTTDNVTTSAPFTPYTGAPQVLTTATPTHITPHTLV